MPAGKIVISETQKKVWKLTNIPIQTQCSVEKKIAIFEDL